MKKNQYIYLWIVILTFLMGGCSKSISQKTIDELKSENNRLINENNQLSKEVDNQKELLDLRNLLDTKFYYLLSDMKHDRIDEIKKEVTPNITVYKDKLVSQLPIGAWDFKFPKENVRFRERSFFLRNPQTYEAVYEVWDPEEERLLECYVEYTLVDTL